MGAGGKGKKKFGEGISAKEGCWWRRKKKFWRRNFGEGWVLRLGVGVAKVNNFLEMGFQRRMGAGSKGKKNLEKEFRQRKGAGGEGKKILEEFR